MTKLADLKARLIEGPEFREKYARIDGGDALIEALVRARTEAKPTQAELASRLGTTPSAVARLEGGRVSPSFATLRRYAEAADRRFGAGWRLRRRQACVRWLVIVPVGLRNAPWRRLPLPHDPATRGPVADVLKSASHCCVPGRMVG